MKMKKKDRDRRHAYGPLLVAVVLALAAFGVALAAGESMPRSLFSGGGGANSAAGIQSQGALGQPVAGAVSDGSSFSNCAGFWCGSGVVAPTITPTLSPTPTVSVTPTDATPTPTITGTPPTPTPTVTGTPPTPTPTGTPSIGGDAQIYLPMMVK